MILSESFALVGVDLVIGVAVALDASRFIERCTSASHPPIP
jgi:hypothetical protein